jgi:hypothetical protein
MNAKTIIEEGIYDIETKLPLKKAIFTFDGKKITRNLFILGDDEESNNKVDIINLEKTKIEVDIPKIFNMSSQELCDYIMEKVKHLEPNLCYERNINNEIPFFENPIITKNREA